MSKVQLRNEFTRDAWYLPTDARGELVLHDRIASRGSGASASTVTTFVASFNFHDPLVCPEAEVPGFGCYDVLEDGNVEVTQLIGRFPTEEERSIWLARNFR